MAELAKKEESRCKDQEARLERVEAQGRGTIDVASNLRAALLKAQQREREEKELRVLAEVLFVGLLKRHANSNRCIWTHGMAMRGVRFRGMRATRASNAS